MLLALLAFIGQMRRLLTPAAEPRLSLH